MPGGSPRVSCRLIFDNVARLTNPAFIHLRVHTEYSLTDGLVTVGKLAPVLAEQQIAALAITDICNFFGLIKFYKALQNAGTKPIIGSDLWVCDGEDTSQAFLMTALAQNDQGYRNLTYLISMAYQEGQSQGRAVVQRQLAGGVGSGSDTVIGRAVRGYRTGATGESSSCRERIAAGSVAT